MLQVWTTSQTLRAKINERIADPKRVVIDNTHLPLRMLHDRVSPPLDEWCPHPPRAADRLKVSYRGQPLICITTALREVGGRYERYREETKALAEQELGDQFDRFCNGESVIIRNPLDIQEGPSPEPEKWAVYQWKWVWRGLRPDLKHPSPLSTELYKGRISSELPEDTEHKIPMHLAYPRRRYKERTCLILP